MYSTKGLEIYSADICADINHKLYQLNLLNTAWWEPHDCTVYETAAQPSSQDFRVNRV